MKKNLSNKYLGGDMDLVESLRVLKINFVIFLCVRGLVLQVIPSYLEMGEVPRQHSQAALCVTQ